MMHKIRKNSRNQFRTKLYAEYVEDDLAQEKVYFGEEYVLVMKEIPLDYPPIDMYWRLNITKVDEPALIKMILMLNFFNPGIDEFGIKLMVQWLIGNHVKLVKIDGKWVSSIAHKDMFDLVRGLRHVECPKEYLISDTVTLFSYSSSLNKNQKAAITRGVRYSRNTLLYSKIIHNAANTLVENTESIKIVSNADVHAKASEQEVRSRKHYDNVILDKTKMLLKLSEDTGLSKNDKIIDKYKEFLELPPMSTREAARVLNTSMTKIKMFNDYKV